MQPVGVPRALDVKVRGMRSVVIFLALALLCGCSSRQPPAVSSPTPASVSPSDPNIAACAVVREIIRTMQGQMANYNSAADLFDKTVATGLRADATALFGQETTATGAVKDAIHAEATGLVNLSIAMDGDDAASLGSSADASSAALAQVRGTCNF
jgi:hypothetical protein